MRIGFCIILLGVLTTGGLASPPFVEQPGVLTFSGQMIVRPVQAIGQARPDAALRSRVADQLQHVLVEHVVATDEFIVTIPSGEDENSFAAQLMATGDYEYVVPNWVCHPVATFPNDGGYWQQWHHDTLRSADAWDLTTGSGVTIAIVDGGVQTDHPDLAAVMVPGYNSRDRIAEVDGGDVTDLDGHGTHVAGLAAAIGNNGTHVVGMGWNFSIMPIRYYNGTGGGLLSDVLEGARWAIDNGAQIINVSQSGVAYAPVQTAGAYVAERGGILLYAAGNDGRDLNWFDWADVVVVGGTDPNDARTTCSAYGAAVDVFAPGVGLLSTYINSGLGLSGCGTSGATPLAAGTAGLIWSRNPCLTRDEVVALLEAGCADLGPAGEDAAWGWGRIDPVASVSLASACGDCDLDGEITGGDGVQAVLCLTGPSGAVASACGCSDLDFDGDVDVLDLADLQPRVQN